MKHDLNIYPINDPLELEQYRGIFRKEQVEANPDGTTYIGLYNHHHLIGFVGWKKIGNSLRFKSDWIHPNWRGNGHYKTLWNERLRRVQSEFTGTDIVKVTAYCTTRSLPMYKKSGFQEVSTNKKNSVTFVTASLNEILQRLEQGNKI